MKIILTTLALTVLAVGSASAGKPPRSHPNGNGKPRVIVVVNDHHGKTFSGGLYYPGRNHNHWSYQCYWPKYKCLCYWDPYTNSYYYWCERDGCYYPISYITKAAPLVIAAPIVVALPPDGVPALPN